MRKKFFFLSPFILKRPSTGLKVTDDPLAPSQMQRTIWRSSRTKDFQEFIFNQKKKKPSMSFLMQRRPSRGPCVGLQRFM